MILEVVPQQTPAEALFHLGVYFFVNDEFADAERQFRAALKEEPRAWDARAKLGDSILAQGRIEEAAAELREAIASAPAPQQPLLWYQSGMAFALHKAMPVAVEFERKAREMSPDNPAVIAKLAWYLATTSDSSARNGPEALSLAQHGITLAPQVAEMQIVLAAALAETGDFTTALAASEKAGSLAKAAGNAELQSSIEKLAAAYRAGKPWRE